MKKAKRIIVSALTALMMTAQMCPPVSAAQAVTYTKYSWVNSELKAEDVTVTDYKTVTWGDRELTEGTYVVSDNNLVLSGRLNVVKGAVVNLVVPEGKTLTCKEGISCGYDKNNKYGTLNIYGTGKIVTTGKGNAAGIGGDNDETNGYITVHGTEIEATGGKHAAGIGGGEGGKDPNENSPTIKIYDGKITATGGIDGAGIGGGDEQPGARTYIYGGDITASSKKHGAGIGGGDEEGTYGVWIYGGKVTATGGDHGAGIGAGEEGGNMRKAEDGGGVNILGGNVTAKGGDGGAGIGGGWGENVSGEIKISGDATKLDVTGGENGAGIGSGGCNNSFKKGDMKAKIEIDCGSESDISIISGTQGAGIGAGEGGNVSGDVYINGGKIRIKAYYGGAGIGGGCEAGQFFIGGEGGTVYIGGGDLTIHVCDYDSKAEAIGSGANDYVSGTVYIAADNNKTNKYMRVSYNKDNDNFFSLPAAANATAKAGDRTDKCHSNCSLFITECDHKDHNGNSGLSYTINKDGTHTKKCKFCGLNEKDTHIGINCECGYSDPTLKEVTLNAFGKQVFTVAQGKSFTLPYSPNELINGLLPTDPYYQVKGWRLSGDNTDKLYEAGSDVTVDSDMEFTVVTEPVYKIKTAENVGADKNEAKAGDLINILVEPQFGYTISRVYYQYITKYDFEGDDFVLDNDPVEINAGEDGKYQLTMPDLTSPVNGIIISAVFEKDTNRVYISEDIKHGTVTADEYEPAADATVTLTVEPDEDHVLDKLSCRTGDGTEIEVTQDPDDETKYTFTMPDESVTVSAEFEENDLDYSYISGASLSLKGDIGVNIYIKPAVGIENSAYVTVRRSFDTTSEKKYIRKLPYDPDNGYKITSQFSAQQMGESVEIRLFNEVLNDVNEEQAVELTVRGSDRTTEYYGDNSFTYSPTDYFATVKSNTIFNDPEKQAKLENLCTAMETYGEYARNYFGDKYKVVGTASDVSSVTEAAIPHGSTAELLPDGVTFIGTTLSLKSETTLSFYFTGDLGNTSFSCYTEVSEVYDSNYWNGKLFFKVETTKSGEYTIVRVRGINAKHLGNRFTLMWGNYAVTYSPMNYCFEVLNDPNSDEKLVNVCKALYLYWQAADTYFG